MDKMDKDRRITAEHEAFIYVAELCRNYRRQIEDLKITIGALCFLIVFLGIALLVVMS